MPEALVADEVWWRYPTYSQKSQPWTLQGINLQVEQGECFGITGPSGAGKTTLCRTLMGILPSNARLTREQLPAHFRGRISLFGEAVTEKTPGSGIIGMVSQDPENQFLRMSVLHEIGLGLQIRGVSTDQIISRAEAALRWVGLERLWHGALYIHPAELSGGQKQRVAIAAFLALRPGVLILDEPTSDLDPLGKREVIETIGRLRHEHDMTVILVEQDPEILAAFCDRIALMYKGYIELVASPPVFYSEQQRLEKYGASVGELVRISWHTGLTYESRPPLTLEEAEIAFAPALEQLNVGGPMDPAPAMGEPQSLSVPRSVAAKIEDVWYEYEDGTTALRGIDLSLQHGEMLALLGPNGSGKTTLAKILAGIYRPTRGQVSVLGQQVHTRKERARLPSRVGYVFQNPDHQLFSRSVSAEIASGLKNIGMAPSERQQVVTTTLEAVGLASLVDEDPLFLSKGERQRLAVAAILAMGPEILIVDEPTTGQDARSVAAIMQLLCDLQRRGKTILVITHDMTLVAEYCQRVVAFREGKVSFTGSPAQLFENADLLEKTGLHPPTTAALATRLRPRYPGLPPLLTVERWCEVLSTERVACSQTKSFDDRSQEPQ